MRKTKGTTKNWENGKLGRSEKHARRASPEAEQAVDEILGITDQPPSTELPVWFEKPSLPGLHMMRYRRGEAFSYHAVRVIFCDDGSGLEWTATYIPGSTNVALNDFNEVSFQKVKE